MIVIKNAKDLEHLRASGRIAAQVRDSVAKAIVPGITTKDIAEHAAELIRAHGAESAFLGYRGFPGQICVSVNEVVVHGIPGARRIQLGDVVSVDIGVKFGGYVGDTATTIMVGVTDPEVIKLVQTAEQALEAGIAVAVAGNRVSDISHAIEQVTVSAGCSVVRKFVGHGIGRDMHEEPQVPNYGRAGRGPVLKPGMTLCLEPMVNMGGYEVDVLDDGWTVVTHDGKPSAHFEHMVAIRDGAGEVLTRC